MTKVKGRHRKRISGYIERERERYIQLEWCRTSGGGFFFSSNVLFPAKEKDTRAKSVGGKEEEYTYKDEAGNVHVTSLFS